MLTMKYKESNIDFIDRRSTRRLDMKTVRDSELRRQEILAAARELFIKKGYDQTSVNDILNVVEIAKGTFYYYFVSKEEVLEAIIMDIVKEGEIKAKRILNDKSIALVNRIMMAMMAQKPDFEGSDEIKDELHKVENTKFHRVYLKEMIKMMTPILEPLFIEGIDQGIFNMEYPTECVESVLLLGHMMFDDSDVFGWSIEEYPKKIQAFLANMERLLGTKKGELGILMQMFGQI